MPEPLKHLYSANLISELADNLNACDSDFDSAGFKKRVLDDDWANKELKQRMHHISICMHKCLSGDYSQNINVLKSVSNNFSGLPHMVFPAFVELYGLPYFDESMSALAFFTENSSSEFAIRPFIKEQQQRTMGQMEAWAESDNYHLRRLSSEGCRPRLPWAMALPAFKCDPQPVLHILNKLKNDESLYVRRSVANNLNDISKDHPGVLLRIAGSWLGDSQETDWLVKHACRSMLKQGEPTLMKIFGFPEPVHIQIDNFLVQEAVAIGDRLGFSFDLEATERGLGRLRIEYAIDFMKKNGKRARKIFKISESENSEKLKRVKREHSFKLISTRKYYPGIHGIAIIINGHEIQAGEFRLQKAT
jgi:3-methyladenine DNA glycosylase AlkC